MYVRVGIALVFIVIYSAEMPRVCQSDPTKGDFTLTIFWIIINVNLIDIVSKRRGHMRE